MKFTNRNIHRDFAYFYLGLIIAFSFSGIILNHREDWYPQDYTYETKSVDFNVPTEKEELTDTYVKNATKEIGDYDGHRIRDGKLRVYFMENAILDIDLNSGKGLVEYKKTVPLVGHSMILHKTTNKFWIWYSDLFGIAMIIIALTGVLIPVGKNGFRKRGWKLALAGMLFPLIFLIFLNS